MMLSERAQKLKPSPTLLLVAKAKELAAKGHDVISLSVGEPDWPTFRAANVAANLAIENGFTKYTPVPGIPELRQAIAKDIEKDIGLSYALNQVVVCTGAKFAIFAALQMLLDDGDEVIIPSPYWVSYPVMVELVGHGRSVIATCTESEAFKLSPQKLRSVISNKSKVLILTSPSNPTGLAYTEEELKGLAEVIREYPNLVVLSDDIYNKLMISGKTAPHLLKVAPDLKDRVLIINGVSKTFSMTGWRIGWAVGPAPLITAISDYASQSTSSANSIAQKAALSALENSDEDIRKSCSLLASRLGVALNKIGSIAGVRAIKPDGAFYIWLDVKGLIGKEFKGQVLGSSKDIALILLESYYVATVPGEEFGCEGYLRLSYATSEAQFAKAMDRLNQLVHELK